MDTDNNSDDQASECLVVPLALESTIDLATTTASSPNVRRTRHPHTCISPPPATETETEQRERKTMASAPEASTAAEAVGDASSGGQKVDPWNVSGEVGADGKVKAIDYKKIVDEFGTKLIDDALLERFERVTGHKPHHFLRRQIVFSHRDLDLILDRVEKKEPFFIYTGRGPSSDSMHIGHVIPFQLTKWLSDVLNAPLVIMMTDDEKFLFSEKRTVEEVQHYTRENAKDMRVTPNCRPSRGSAR
ncbi:Tryptophan--tRNA ligase, cytoplasmic [Colletotrichum tanaceti]|nr:Tryptophan--tRNA ligase, cytoplasmic [Colletotrichum tanaceti]